MLGLKLNHVSKRGQPDPEKVGVVSVEPSYEKINCYLNSHSGTRDGLLSVDIIWICDYCGVSLQWRHMGAMAFQN